MSEDCAPDETHLTAKMNCQLAPPGVLSSTLRAWADGYGWPDEYPWWEEQQTQYLDRDIALILLENQVYNSWSYRGTCWKKQKFN